MKPHPVKEHAPQETFLEIATLSDESQRETFLNGHPDLVRSEVVEQLAEAVRERVRVDTQQALGLAEGAVAIARRLQDGAALARSFRAKANALYFLGQNRSSLELHQRALALYEELGNGSEVARTLSASIQPMILLGEYDQALAAAERARGIFTARSEPLRLARLDINLGNVFHRQDRFLEALACYERAYEQLLPDKDAEGIAATLHNMAVCLTSLNDFPRALECYRRARSFCEEHQMPLAVVQADYNIAYLYYLRGEYSRAIEGLRATRESAQKAGDPYHWALCHLDLSEIYVESNLSEEAAEVAELAFVEFQKLEMGYEAAKALTNLAIVLSQQGKADRAVAFFVQAKAIFVREKNYAWPSLVDLYQALVLFREDRLAEARELCLMALQFFETSPLLTKAVLCHLLLAHISLRSDDADAANEECTRALALLEQAESPLLNHQAHFLVGQVQEARGEMSRAYESYQRARRAVEILRSNLHGEELKIAFMQNRLEVYERLVHLCLSRGSQQAAEEAFVYMEEAKSRSLRDLIFRRGHPLPAPHFEQTEIAKRVSDLREELDWYYHRIELEQLRPDRPSPLRLEDLRDQARSREQNLLRILRDSPFPDREYAALHEPAPITLEEIRALLGPETILVEYFPVRDLLFAAVVSQERMEVVPISLMSRVTHSMRLLQLQLSKFQLGAEYAKTFGDSLLRATRAHLRELHEALIAPLRSRLKAGRLTIVPHGALHYLPFHALFDGQRYLIDHKSFVYAPSASVHTLCQRKPANTTGPSLILGVPDARTPFILEEVETLSGIIPGSELYLAENASEEKLRERGPHCRFVHIATHGHFRQDNPMFSGIRLGTNYLSLYDLYRFHLPAELITLSGCGTGLNVVAAGDELLGLARGLLYAGAQSLLLTLWDVYDKTTAFLMRSFYRTFQESGDKASALQRAMLELREDHPHPYYWAPFKLLG